MTPNSIIFILSLIMNVFVTSDIIRTVTDCKFRFFEKYDKKIHIVSLILTVIFIILGILDMVNSEFLGLHGYYQMSAIYLTASCILTYNYKFSEKNRNFFGFAIKSFTVIMLLELFMFNFDSYGMILGNYPVKVLPVSDAESVIIQETNTSYTYTFRNINIPVGTVAVDAQIEGVTKEFVFDLSISDETSKPLRNKIAKISAIPGYSDSYKTNVLLSGKVGDLQIQASTQQNQSLNLSSVILNSPIAVHFSFTRFLILMGGALFSYAVINLKKFTQDVNKDKKFFRITIKIATLFAIAAITVMTFTSKYTECGFKELFFLEKGDQITQDIVDAFKCGHTYMTFEPSEEILKLENPYDYNLRQENKLYMNSNYAWDHLLYNGKYYSYYGIAPVILLFLPYHLITGYYFSTSLAIYIAAVIGVIFLSGIYMEFIERYFGKLSVGTALTGGIIMIASCGIYVSVARPLFYEIAMSFGFAFICSGAYFLLTSNVMGSGVISLKRITLSTILLSLAVLSRPTTAVYCICAVVFILMSYRKAAKQCKSKIPVKYLLCSFLPFVIIGSVQMIYNYVRFGSPLDFGIQYSLTINDFTHSQFHTKFVFITIFNYLFNIPAITPVFPFFKTDFHDFNLNGYYYRDYTWISGIPTGLIARATPVIAYLFAKKAYNRSSSLYKRKYAGYIALMSIAAPFTILFSIWESGYSARYTSDFSWEILIGAYAILYTLIIKCKNEDIKRIFSKIFTASAFLSIAVNFAQFYSFFISKSVSENHALKYLILERMFNFWK